MTPPVILSPAAEHEIAEAARWYDRQAGLGESFVERVHEAFAAIAETPELHATIYRNIRRVRVRRFPYGVYYRLLGNRVEVIAVLHDKRDPRLWQART